MATGTSKTKWNGKEKGHSTPHVLENALDIELTYQGKRSEQAILETQPVSVRLMWQADSAQEPSCRLYFGDNLPLLALLLQIFRGQVRLIYIDPPFATNSIFQSRAQNDAYADLLIGSRYVEFIRERLILLRELLAEDGSIYIHLDENMAFYIKAIMDEVFGRKNFRNWITRKKCNPKNYTHKTYGNISDYILFYTKSDSYVWNRPLEMWTQERAEKEYQYIEPESGRRYKKVPVHAPGVRNGETGKPWRGKMPPLGKHWQYPPKTLDEMDARGEIYWSPNGNPRRKVYFDESEGVPIQDIWLDFKDAHNQNVEITGYPTEKNPEMLAQIIKASSNPGDLVLDCFSGSGTTLAVSSHLGRRWIGIDNSTEAISTTLRRFAKGLEPMGDFVKKQEQQEVIIQPSFFSDMEGKSTDTQEVAAKGVIKKRHLINNFSLYAAEHLAGDLDTILHQWLEWQRK